MLQKHGGILKWLSMAAGVVLTALTFPMFFIPNQIAPGGLTGISTLINALTGLPVGLMTIFLNLPLFLISWKRMGSAFSIKSLLCMVSLSAIIDLLPIGPVTDDPILAAVFGGTMLGFGVGLVIRGGATTGGTDMAATLIHERFPAISVGGLLLAIDFCVIAASGVVFNVQSALYALICVFLSSRVMDRTVEGFGSAKAFFIFSSQAEAIAKAVLTEISRGATLLHGRGAYTREERDVLLCVVTRLQIPQLKTLVKSIDPTAFVMVTDVREALGEGFTRPAADKKG